MATRRDKEHGATMRNSVRTYSRPQTHLHRCHAHLVLRNVTVGPCALLLAATVSIIASVLPGLAVGLGEEPVGGTGQEGWGVPDMRAAAGRVFMYQIPQDVFGTAVEKYKVTEVDSEKLPHWLEFDQSTRTIFGVPMVTDEGLYYITVAAMATNTTHPTSDIFQVEVVLTETTARPESLQFDPIQGDFLQVRKQKTLIEMTENVQQSKTVCYDGETRAVVRLSVDLGDLSPRQRVDLVVKFAQFVRRDPQSLKLSQRRSSNIGKLLEESVLVAGPGDANISTVLSLRTSTELSWQLSCGLFRGTGDFAKVMEHNAMEGVLTRVLGVGVIGWQVTSSASREERRKRQAAGFATPMPTPTATLFPPSAISTISTATPAVESTPSAFSTAPLPSLPSLSLSSELLSPTITPSMDISPTLEATESLSLPPLPPSTGISPSPVVTGMPVSSTPAPTSTSPVLTTSTASSLGVLPTVSSSAVALQSSSPVLSVSPTVPISGISSPLLSPTIGSSPPIQSASTSVREVSSTAVQQSSSILPTTGISSSMELPTTPSTTAVPTTSLQLSVTPSPTPGSTTTLTTTAVEVQSSTAVPLPTPVTSLVPALSSTSAVSTSRKFDTASVIPSTVAQSSISGPTSITGLVPTSSVVTASSSLAATSELATLSSALAITTALSTRSTSFVTPELATTSVFVTSVSVTSGELATSVATTGTLSTTFAPSVSTELATPPVVVTSLPLATSVVTTSRLSTTFAPSVSTELATPPVVVTSLPLATSSATSSSASLTAELATSSVPVSSTPATPGLATASVSTSASAMLSGPSSPTVTSSPALSSLTPSLPSSSTITPSPSPTSFPGDQLTPSTPFLSSSAASSLSSFVFTVPTSSTLPTPSLPVVSPTAPLVSNSTFSTLPTPSPAVVSSTAVVSSSSTPTVPPNQPPLLVNHLDHLQVAAGQVYYSRVPYDTFYDMEDAMNTRGLTLELVALDGTTWLFLNHAWQALYGIPPLDSANQVYQFILVASDSQGLATRDSFQLTVTAPPTPSHIFTAVINIDYTSFHSNIHNWIDLSEKISTHFRDRDTNFILVDSVQEGSVVFSWSNISLSSTTCQNATIQRLAAELLNPDGTVNSEFVTSLSPEYPVTEARVRYQGVCDLAAVSPTPTTAATLVPAPLSHSTHLLNTVVPAACLAAILLLLGVIACCLYRSKKSGKKLPKYDKLTLTKNRKPIVLEDEFEMKDTKPSKPIVLPEEKPPATQLPTRRPAPPPYRIPDTQQLLGGMEPQATALPPPPRYTASVPRKPPPPYRLPPPYTPSASPLPAPLSFADTKV